MSIDTYSRELVKFGITKEDLDNRVQHMVDPSDTDYIIVPTDDFSAWEFVSKDKLLSSFTTINSTSWRKFL